MAVRDRRDFDAMTLLRSQCLLLSSVGLAGNDAPEVLRNLRAATEGLTTLMHSNDATLRTVLIFASNTGLLQLDEAWSKYLDDDAETLAADDDPEVPSIIAFLNCQVSELRGYRHYLEDLSPFATQQGVKGAEFERVLVLIDDDEGRGQRLFSYEKYFNIAPPSETDQENIDAGDDNVIDRTRRLFYVCCSRAKRDLAVVMFVRDLAAARGKIEESGIFMPDDIVDESALELD
ncbi:hypothetical protein [Burkholderia aenigmatica]|nr:hypothetical protein [Burkholderia aenigmatica]